MVRPIKIHGIINLIITASLHYMHAHTQFYSNFTENRNSPNIDSSLTDELVHSSALLAFRFPVELSGCNKFDGNIGGGITLMNARLNVRGELLLLNNVAMFGGGIAMDDSCLVSY